MSICANKVGGTAVTIRTENKTMRIGSECVRLSRRIHFCVRSFDRSIVRSYADKPFRQSFFSLRSPQDNDQQNEMQSRGGLFSRFSGFPDHGTITLRRDAFLPTSRGCLSLRIFTGTSAMDFRRTHVGHLPVQCARWLPPREGGDLIVIREAKMNGTPHKLRKTLSAKSQYVR